MHLWCGWGERWKETVFTDSVKLRSIPIYFSANRIGRQIALLRSFSIPSNILSDCGNNKSYAEFFCKNFASFLTFLAGFAEFKRWSIAIVLINIRGCDVVKRARRMKQCFKSIFLSKAYGFFFYLELEVKHIAEHNRNKNQFICE